MLLKFVILFACFLGLLTVIFLMGPRPKVDTTLRSIQLPDDLDSYLAASEARFDDIKPNVEKRIDWAGRPSRKTALSIVYLHGFSATHREIAPVCELVAEELEANAYFTRLAGHGRGPQAMLEGSVNDWINDANEALEIGRRIGERVLIIATSNGGSLATWLVANQERQDDIAGLVLISPNFGPRDKRSRILTWPWGGVIAEWIQGKTFHWKPKNALHARYWTIDYPTKTLSNMQAVVELAKAADKSRISAPALVLYTRRDQIVDPKAIESAFATFGSQRKRLAPVESASEDGHHVLAGDALSPQSTEEVAGRIIAFAKAEEPSAPGKTSFTRRPASP